MKNFVLLGAAGYVAPKHMKAIKDNGGNLIAAMDKHDSVGVLDSFFPECNFFTDFERLDRFCYKTIKGGTPIDYVSICTPNYLHDSQSMWALRIGADAIVEKPIVCNERNLDALASLENETGRKTWAILQCRLLPIVDTLKRNPDMVEFNVEYVTPRGAWYKQTWKNDVNKSGGLATNIGVHLFDLLHYLFGDFKGIEIFSCSDDEICGAAHLGDKGKGTWRLSINRREKTKRVFTLKDINGRTYEIDLTSGFGDLHSLSYKAIVNNNGFGIEDTREAVRAVESIRGRIYAHT